MVDEPADGRLIRTARRFLRDTVEQFARLSRQYWDVVGEPPFIYSERQLHSVLFPAVVRASDAGMRLKDFRAQVQQPECLAWGYALTALPGYKLHASRTEVPISVNPFFM